jgi:hypothetical protein
MLLAQAGGGAIPTGCTPLTGRKRRRFAAGFRARWDPLQERRPHHEPGGGLEPRVARGERQQGVCVWSRSTTRRRDGGATTNPAVRAPAPALAPPFARCPAAAAHQPVCPQTHGKAGGATCHARASMGAPSFLVFAPAATPRGGPVLGAGASSYEMPTDLELGMVFRPTAHVAGRVTSTGGQRCAAAEQFAETTTRRSPIDRRTHHIDEELPLSAGDRRPSRSFPRRRRRLAPNGLALC